MRIKPTLAAVALAILVGGLVSSLLSEQEPRYESKRLSAWVAQLDQELPNANYVETNGPAATAIQQIGTNAIPYLRRLLNARDSRLKTKLINLSRRQNGARLPLTSSNDWRKRAAFATFCLGERGSPLMPEVMNLFRDADYETAFTVSTVVGCIGYGNPETLPALILALEDKSPLVRRRAAFALDQLHTCFLIVDVSARPHGELPESRCKVAIPALQKALKDSDAEVRRIAAQTLHQIAPDTAIPIL